MCLSVPAEVIAINGKKADALVYQQKREVYLSIDNVKVGDWVLIYGGIALTKLDAETAKETLALVERLHN